MDTIALQRLDSWPYRHRLADVMRTPLVCAQGHETLRQGIARMAEHRVSAVIVVDADGHATGIVTERDALIAVARGGGTVLDGALETIMSSPVDSLPTDALVYRALGRLDRRGFRHLLVVDGGGLPVGMVTPRSLLRHRTANALMLGDEIDTATEPAALRRVHDRLPELARRLRAEEVPAVDITAVIGAITRDLTARAAAMVLAMPPVGEPPAAWCLLVLGSAGRGESLLAPDQDNALVHDGDPASVDGWFAAFGERLNDALDRIGIPLCKGNVMVRNPAFRRSLQQWLAAIDDWVGHPKPEALLDVDIFFDGVPVAGDRRLARSLRSHMTQRAARSPSFLRLLATQIDSVGSPFDLIGRLRTVDGRIDLKKHGTFPIVAAARIIGLACASAAVATDERLAVAAASGALKLDDVERLQAARGVIVGQLLQGQLGDIAAGRPPGNALDLRSLGRNERDRLKSALREVSGVSLLVQDAVTAHRIAD